MADGVVWLFGPCQFGRLSLFFGSWWPPADYAGRHFGIILLIPPSAIFRADLQRFSDWNFCVCKNIRGAACRLISRTWRSLSFMNSARHSSLFLLLLPIDCFGYKVGGKSIPLGSSAEEEDSVCVLEVKSWAAEKAGSEFGELKRCKGEMSDCLVLQVYGIPRLRVVDASIMPNIVSGTVGWQNSLLSNNQIVSSEMPDGNFTRGYEIRLLSKVVTKSCHLRFFI